MKNIFFLWFLIALHSCQGQPEPSVPEQKAVTPDTLSSISEKPKPAPDSLDRYLKSPLDWDAYKDQVRNMLNCGKKAMPLAEPDSVGLFYNYCLFNAMLGDKSQSHLKHNEAMITFHTWKKSLKGTEGYYHAKNEKLLGIQCRITDEHLGTFNWVEKDSVSVITKIGQPQRKTASQFYYYKDNYLLVLNFEKEKISWFKYFRLAEPVKETDFTDKRLTNWDS